MQLKTVPNSLFPISLFKEMYDIGYEFIIFIKAQVIFFSSSLKTAKDAYALMTSREVLHLCEVRKVQSITKGALRNTII